MAIQHTQGKWTTHGSLGDLQIIVDNNETGIAERIASVHCFDHHIPSYNESKANAALIVDAVNNTAGKGIDPNAVPGLLEALQCINEWTEAFDGSQESLEDMRDNIKDISTQAIKSAELK